MVNIVDFKKIIKHNINIYIHASPTEWKILTFQDIIEDTC
jgi:hypothetical protein